MAKKKLKYIGVLVLFWLFSLQLYTQNDTDKKFKLIFSFDARNSLLVGHPAKFWGVKLGLESESFRFGLGLYGTRNFIRTTNFSSELSGTTDTIFFEYSYLSPYIEPIIFRSKRWDFSAPIHFNVGSVRANVLDTSRILVPLYKSKDFGALTFSLKGHYKIWRWLGIGAGLGYNVALSRDVRIRKSASAPFYSMGVKIFIGEIYRMIFNRDKLKEW